MQSYDLEGHDGSFYLISFVFFRTFCKIQKTFPYNKEFSQPIRETFSFLNCPKLSIVIKNRVFAD